jgi:hypothetical protein
VGGAIVAASIQTRPRYTLSAADSTVAWRMDTWSGQIDLCRAVHLPAGPLVQCGALTVSPAPPATQTPDGDPSQPPASTDTQRSL